MTVTLTYFSTTNSHSTEGFETKKVIKHHELVEINGPTRSSSKNDVTRKYFLQILKEFRNLDSFSLYFRFCLHT